MNEEQVRAKLNEIFRDVFDDGALLCVENDANFTTTMTNAALQQSQHYLFQVKAVAESGEWSAARSDSFVFDNLPPTAGLVNDIMPTVEALENITEAAGHDDDYSSVS